MTQINQIIDYLINLVNIDTTIDSQNEIEAANYIKGIFDDFKINSKIYEPRPGRGSIFSIIKGQEDENIILYSHLDTANYKDQNWLFPPDTATTINNCLVGRGTLDCKGLTSIWLKIFIDIYLSDKKPRKNIIFLACADEESGGTLGLKYILDNTNLLDNTILVLSEGGGYPVLVDNKQYFTIQTGEITKPIEHSYTKKEISEIFRLAIDKGYYSKTTLNFYNKRHLQVKRKIPAECFYKSLETILYDDKVFNYKEYFKLIERHLKTFNGDFELLPIVTPGYSDNRFFREKNITTLGFFPLNIKNNISGIHGPNEYISFKSIEFSYKFLSSIISSLIY